jgi:hypothetical protein
MNRNILANGSEIEAAEAGRGTLAARADPQVEAECAALFRPTLPAPFGGDAS